MLYSPSSIECGPDLLDAFQVTRVRVPEDFDRLTHERAAASDQGSTLYCLREPARAADAGQDLTTFGNTRIGGLMLSYVGDRLATEARILEAHPLGVCIMAVLAGSVQFRMSATATAGVAGAGGVLLCQVQPGAQATTADGCERMNLWINAATLARHLEQMLGQRLAEPLMFAPAPAWPGGVSRSLERLVHYVCRELADPYSLFAGGVGTAEFEALVIRTLLDGVPHNYAERLTRAAGVSSSRALRRAIDFMRENLTRPLTVEQVADAAGCSARSLGGAFRTKRGQTVAAALRDLRLDAARDVFAGGEPVIRDVAARFCFSNPGRFSRQYRERFGAPPSAARHGSGQPGRPLR